MTRVEKGRDPGFRALRTRCDNGPCHSHLQGVQNLAGDRRRQQVRRKSAHKGGFPEVQIPGRGVRVLGKKLRGIQEKRSCHDHDPQWPRGQCPPVTETWCLRRLGHAGVSATRCLRPGASGHLGHGSGRSHGEPGPGAFGLCPRLAHNSGLWQVGRGEETVS